MTGTSREPSPAGIGAELLAKLLAAGYTVWPDAGGLRIHPAARLSAEARATIRAHRRAILAAHAEQVRQIRPVIDEIVQCVGWSEKDVAKMMRAAQRYPDLEGWQAFRDRARASAETLPPDRDAP